MRFLVVGAGSTGGYFGGRLAQAGRDVTFLVRPNRADSLRQNGLEIVSPHGDLKLHPKLVTAGHVERAYDAVILAVKAYTLDAAMDDLAAAMGPETMILPVLNGMKHVDTLTARFGDQALIGCACKIAAMVDDQGRIVQLSPIQEIVYGEMDGSDSARTKLLDEQMRSAGFDARLSRTIARDMWEKWVLLATAGAINCLMRGNLGEVQAAIGGAALMVRLLDEVTAVVRAVGVAPSEAFLLDTKASLLQPGSKLTTSMYRDLQRGAPIEAEQIVGDLVARAQRAGIDVPLLAAAFTHLCVYQTRRAAP
jgi:2-dehydropantoate 2-reductase